MKYSTKEKDYLVNSQARSRSLGFLGSHFENSESFTTDLIVCQVTSDIIREKIMLKFAN